MGKTSKTASGYHFFSACIIVFTYFPKCNEKVPHLMLSAGVSDGQLCSSCIYSRQTAAGLFYYLTSGGFFDVTFDHRKKLWVLAEASVVKCIVTQAINRLHVNAALQQHFHCILTAILTAQNQRCPEGVKRENRLWARKSHKLELPNPHEVHFTWQLFNYCWIMKRCVGSARLIYPVFVTTSGCFLLILKGLLVLWAIIDAETQQ